MIKGIKGLLSSKALAVAVVIAIVAIGIGAYFLMSQEEQAPQEEPAPAALLKSFLDEPVFG
ncbi:hypothetical protein AKJ65_02885 [candidate division MSBL1 archaeon SCGC-AAA259E19]|uniref:Uncharacterized protein n=1 Tax=candidate division MSBL1 archaeon SCGC-AAA259E19 TaxID=1698264 RepID=A0A133UL65_9EURY|nr:hypothetical protein AKJ65_02885 [candidate division MSBL1 archaeon SCGC-AAA259E19]